ncbi:MAG: ABC transporter permease [Solirubrobacterales bacterium]
MEAIADTGALAPPSFSRPAFVRLVQIELRKSIDTRAGYWLLAATAALTVIAAIARAITGDDSSHALLPVLETALAPTNVLLPVVGILLITSEWSQRTALTTFVQVPGRLRVVTAKCAAGLALGFVFYAIAIGVSVLAVATLGAGAPEQWAFGAEMWLQFTAYVVLGMLMGLALGAALLASAPAIVTYFAAPTVVVILASFNSLESVLKWVDPSAMAQPMTQGPMSSAEFGHLLTSTAVWVAVPLAIGCWRISRADID